MTDLTADEPIPPPCDPEDGYCSHPRYHTSLDCYPRYFELEYEGPQGGQVMTHEEWTSV